MRHDRKIKVNKQELIDIVKKNKEAHIIDYAEAVVAYKKEALRQLRLQTKAVNKGALVVRINLTSPINEEKSYDKIIRMFEMDVQDEVEISVNEFNEYVLDETSFALQAKMSNSSYRG